MTEGMQSRGPLAWMAGNSVAANLVMLLFLVGGLIMAKNVKQEVFPEFTTDTVRVSIPYPGASPEEVEEGIILAVEEAVQDLEGVKEISSTASEGSGMVTVEALEGADLTRLWQDVESEVNRITTFPDEAEDPVVSIGSHKRGVLTLALSGTDDELVLRETAEMVRDELLQDEGVTQVELSGVRDFEIQIEISQTTLRRYDLTLDDVAGIIARSSVDLGGGTLKTSSGDILVRVKDRRNSALEYENIPVISRENGSQVLLSDIARVSTGFEEVDSWSRVNGWDAVMIEVYRIGGQTPIAVSEAARSVVDRLNQTMPGNLSLEVLRDRSEIFGQRAQLLLKNAYLGLGLVFILLALFLEARLAFWVSLGIPISFLGSFLFLAATPFSVNMITMFAFIVTLGIVVDDAIVVGENIYHHRRAGRSMAESAVIGTREVAMPVVFSVLTNMVAFTPMFFIPGVMGKIFKFIPMVVVCVFAVSLIESLFVLPAHLAHIGEKRQAGPLEVLSRWQQGFSTWVEKVISHGYGPVLGRALANRYVVLALGIAVLSATLGFVRSGRMGFVLFPTVESDYAFVQATLPSGPSRDRLKEVEARLTSSAQEVIETFGGTDLATALLTVVDENSVQARIYLTDPETRPASTSEVTREWRQRTGQISGLQSITFEADRGGPGGGKGLTIRLSHRDRDLLEQAGRDLAEALSRYSGVSDIDDGSASGKDQFDIHLSRLGERLGLTSRDVANQVRHAFYGAEAKKQQQGRNEVTVRVRYPEDERRNPDTLEDMVLRTPQGEILLRDAARIVPGQAYTAITRTDGRRVVTVTANVTPRSRAEQILSGLKADVLPELKKAVPGLTYSFEGRQADIQESVSSLMQGLLLALLGLYGLLAIPFRSYFQPLIIMICIPFGMVGAVIGHLLMGYSLSVMSLFGIVALTGVVINDSLILIHFANLLRKQEHSIFRAVQLAGMQRFRPILLTTLTTFGGLSPMILETSRQARFLIPMAVSLGFGLLFATLIILFLIPCVYLILEDLAGLLKRKPAADSDPAGIRS